MPRPAAIVAAIVAAVVAAAAGVAMAGPVLPQGRTVQPIPTRPRAESREPVPAELAPPLPAREECELSVRAVAAAYGSADLEPLLHERFPNRNELLDALDRLNLRVTGIELVVESIESLRVLPWQAAGRRRGGETGILTADCIVDLRTRLVFDDLETGERTVTDPARTEWRLRFTAEEGE